MYAVMAILAAAGIGFTSDAFAEEQITVMADNDKYDHMSTINVSGHVDSILSGVPITLIMVSPNGSIVTIDQISVDKDGNYSTSISTAGSLLQKDGMYVIKVTYGSSSVSDDLTVELVGSDDADVHPMTVTTTDTSSELDLMSQLDYKINGAKVIGVVASPHENALVIEIDSVDDGELIITLSDDVITSLEDGTFFVLIDNEESMDELQDGNVLTIPFEFGTSKITIIGSHVVPEFGTIAAMVLVIAIISIIAVSAKTRLNIISKQ